MDTSLKLYYVANDGTTRNFPEGNYEQAEIHDFTVNKTRMGNAPTITATLEYPYCLDGEWGRVCHFDDVYVVFNNERYYLKATPSSSKLNDKLFYKHELNFVSERAVLETVYMIDDLENQTENILLSNNTQITFFGNIAQFVERINQSMYFSGIGDTCVYDTSTTPPTINPLPRTPNGDGFYVVVDSTVTNTDEVLVTLSNNTIADALKQLFDKWGVPYYFMGRIIHVGDYEEVTDADYAVGGVLGAGVNIGVLVPYEYGQPNSVLQVSRANSTKQIYNRCSGTGSSDNIPYYYPNPTPSGTIHLEVNDMPGSTLDASDLTINSYLKFSNLGVNDALVWVKKTQDVLDEVSPQKEFFFNGNKVEFQVPNPPLIPPSGYQAAPAPVPQELEYGLESKVFPIYDEDDPNDIIGYETRYRLTPTTATLSVRVRLQKPYYKLNFEFATECATDVEWEFREYGGLIRFMGVGRLFEYEGNALDEGSVYTLSISKTYTPNDQNWYLLGRLPSRITQVSVDNLVRDAEGWLGWYGDNQKLWVLQSSGMAVNLADYGLEIDNTATVADGDSIIKVVDKWVVPQEKLMPYCYRLSDGRKKFYPALNYPMPVSEHTPDPDLGDAVSLMTGNVENDNYKDESSVYYGFDNPYRRLKQKEHIYDMPDIKPSIEGMTNQWGSRIDMIEEFEYDINDDNSGYFDENGNWNFNHPYFFALLRPTSTFDLFEQAIEEGKMTIAFTSGQCAPCEFEIAVDKDTQKNLVQIDYSTGNLVRDADGDVICGRKNDAVAPQTYQNNTRTHRVWLALKKDTSTYGESSVMPFNDGTVTIRPKACTNIYTDDGDTFVILHIEMPQAYVEAAEQRLTKEIVKQMNKDNNEKFNMSLKYDRVYLGENQDLIDILSENVKVQARYNGITKDYFVSSYSYRIQPTSPIPEINIGGLVETVEELKSVASAGGSFMQKIGEHISENFAELMMGFNKPFTRIVNQNNTQVANQIKGGLPTDYVRTNMELSQNGVVIGSGGRLVQILPVSNEGYVLTIENGMPCWRKINVGLSGETIYLQNALTVQISGTEITEFTETLSMGKYLVNVTLNIVQAVGEGSRAVGVFTTYIIYKKNEVCTAQSYINGCGQLCISTILDIDDDTEEVKTYIYCDTSSSNNFSVVNSVSNNTAMHYNASNITFLKIS